MQLVKLNNGISIPQLGLGTSQMKTPAETVEAIKTAIKSGYRLIDTAKLYGNETEIGKGVRESGVPREELVVTTKLWPDDFGKPREAFLESLARLGLDYVDIYLVHWPQGFTPEVWKTLEALVGEGLIKTIGVSNFSIEQLEALLSYAKIKPAINQVLWNPFAHDLALLNYCKAQGIALEGYKPLTRGEVGHADEIEAIGKAHGKSYAQVMIRWSLEHGVITIPKTTDAARLKENLEVFDFSLTSQEMAVLDALSS